MHRSTPRPVAGPATDRPAANVHLGTGRGAVRPARSRLRRAAALLALSLPAWLAACGGGGDDSAPASGFLFDNTRIDLAWTDGDRPPPGFLTARPQGNLPASFYVRLTSDAGWPDPRFDELSGAGTATSLSILVRPAAALRAGQYDGTLTFEACHDEACARRVSGTPLRVPFRFTVLPGIRVESPLQNLSARVGETFSTAVSVSLPAGVSGLTVSTTSPGFSVREVGDGGFVMDVQAVRGAVLTDGQLTLRAGGHTRIVTPTVMFSPS